MNSTSQYAFTHHSNHFTFTMTRMQFNMQLNTMLMHVVPFGIKLPSQKLPLDTSSLFSIKAVVFAIVFRSSVFAISFRLCNGCDSNDAYPQIQHKQYVTTSSKSHQLNAKVLWK